jgi:ribosome-binding protein aMBF1 (putative translation factor)
MYKCALCGKETNEIRQMINGRTGKSPKGFKFGDELIVLKVCEDCYQKIHPENQGINS